MKDILIIMKKELKRFFTDRRMLLMLILPGILIFVMYNFMGGFISGSFTPDKNYKYVVYTVNEPTKYADVSLDKYDVTKKTIDENMTIDMVKEKIQNKEVDLLIQYDADFTTTTDKPHVSMFYNSVSNESAEIFKYYCTALEKDAYELVYNFYINSDTNVSYDLATKEDSSAKLITMMLPFLLMIFLYSGCMAISSEAIAGEKERGTIATLLVTPAKRRDIAMGKILALSITSLVSAFFSFLGLIGSLPKLFGGADVDMNIYGIGSYLGILGVIIVTVILFTVVLSMLSTLAKSVKEASQLALPVMMIVMAVGITSFIGSGASNEIWAYLIPVYNSVNCMVGIFSLEFNGLNFLLTIISNIVIIAVGIFGLTKMFNSEKIMFNK